MIRHLNQVIPAAPPQAYKTYSIHAPLSTHFRAATCAEVACPHHVNGWSTVVDTLHDPGPAQAYYIRKQSGRRFVETAEPSGIVVFEFEPGQRCFDSSAHRVRVERPEIFVVRGGDWRAYIGDAVQRNANDWVDDFANHQIMVATARERG